MRFYRHFAAGGVLIALGSLPFCLAGADVAFSPDQTNHWSFQNISAPPVPAVHNQRWVRNPIDAFVLAELEKHKLTPSPAADRITLIRRAYLDLIGLPPEPEAVQSFVTDPSPQAFERVVDHLLASPQYGERWARHWLDLARYAESEGFKADETRPNAWRYRDYVIRSLNADKPYDRFMSEQIAGDELWPDDPDARLATGFNRHYPDESNARNLMQRRQEILNDITDTVGAVFTGVTYACARCHNHKFDPILQKDYYRLQAFFANTAAADNVPLASAPELAAYRKKLTGWEEQTASIRAEMAALEEPQRAEIIKDYVDKYPEEIQMALQKPEADRTPFECQMVAKAKLYLDPSSHQYIAPLKIVVAKLKGEERQRWADLRDELEHFAALHPGPMPIGAAIVDLSDTAPATHLLRRGMWNAPREEVEPGFLTLLDPNPAVIATPADLQSTGRRSALARILVDPKNPLPTRVIVNRVWHYHFGMGIVRTPSDFGLKGDRPTHPALLDWLAQEFVARGWSLKALHKLILTSNTYQQSSRANPAALRADPENKLWWRYPRHRLEGEIIRDSALAVSGLLNLRMGGPSVFPDLPAGMVSRGGWSVNKEPEERNRRSVYVFVRRNTRYPLFETFDMPDTHETCARRNRTTSPLQALTLLNNEVALEWAEALASRVLSAGPETATPAVDRAFQLTYGRLPTAGERHTVQQFFERHRKILAQSPELRETKRKLPPGIDRREGEIWIDFCHALINSNEFVYLN